MLQEFSGTLDIDTTLQHVTSLVKQYLEARGLSLFLLENDGQELVCRVCASTPDISGVRLSASEGIVGRAIREAGTQMVRDVREDPDFYQEIDRSSGVETRSILCAPLMIRGKCIGALEAINKDSGNGLFSDDDCNLLAILADASAIAIQNAHMAEELVMQERTRHELELAREIQTALLPGNNERYPVYGINMPARMVSGDFYDHFQLDDGRICFGLGDVSGKGINASLLMAKTASLFRCLGKRITSPAELLSVLNDELYANATRGMFVTMVAGIFDPASQRVTMVNAGHQPPLLHNSDDTVAPLQSAGPPLGILGGLVFEESEFNLHGGDLYIFTDGLTECWFRDRQQLGENGVIDMIREFTDIQAPDRLQAIVQSVTRWKRDQSGYLFDDVTMLLLAGH